MSNIDIVNVCKSFQTMVALNEINLQIEKGEFFSLLGPSGCGKTTLLRMIAGFETPSSGKVLLDGKDMSGMPPHKRCVNMVFQSYALFPHLSVFENIAFGLKVKKSCPSAEIPGRVKDALATVRLSGYAERFPQQLSGGQQQRVSLARAIVNRPTVLLLDEPLSALDLKIREEMQDELSRIQRELGITFVMVTHDQGEALALSDRIAVLFEGFLEQVDRPKCIYEKPKTAFVANFIGQTNLLAARVIEHRLPHVRVSIGQGREIWVQDNPDLCATKCGDEVVAWVRTNCLRLSAKEADAAASGAVNCLPVKVIGRSYQGTKMDYRLELEGGIVLKSSSASGIEPGFAPGDNCFVTFAFDAGSILPKRAGKADKNPAQVSDQNQAQSALVSSANER